MELPILRDLFILFALCVGVIFVCNRIKIPPLVGFLLTGVICGPYGLGLVGDVHQVEILAEIGIVLLLFSIGMELHMDMLMRLKKFVLIGGSTQAILTIAAMTLVVYLLGSSLAHGVFVGFIITLSSTAIVLNYFQQKGQMDSPQGHICLAILIYQDLIVVPMMLLIPVLSGVHYDFDPQMLLVAGGSLGMIVVGFVVSRKFVPILLSAVVRTGSRELFNISILTICIAIALLTSSLGLSLALGAFLAGIILAESEYSQRAMEGVSPFKDIFTSIFFISIGMLLNVAFALDNIWLVLGLAITMLLGKTIITTGVTKILGYPWRTALVVGLALSQVGEFSFVLAKQGLDANILTASHYQLILAASVLTMALTPFILSSSPAIAKKLVSLFGQKTTIPQQAKDEQKAELRDHLIIVGFGLGGQYLAKAAKDAGIKYVILEMNPDNVHKYRQKGEPIFYGDGRSLGVLDSLNVSTARVMVVVISDRMAVRGVVRTAREMNPKLHIVVRSVFLDSVPLLKKLGASDVVAAEFETALEIFARVLSHYLVPSHEIERMDREIRAVNYSRSRRSEASPISLQSLAVHLQHEVNVNTYVLGAESSLLGKTLAEAKLRQKLNLTVVAVLREDELISNPAGDFTFECDDVAYVFGQAEMQTAGMHMFTGLKKEVDKKKH